MRSSLSGRPMAGLLLVGVSLDILDEVGDQTADDDQGDRQRAESRGGRI